MVLIGNKTKLRNVFSKKENSKLLMYNIDIYNINKLPPHLLKHSIVINASLMSEIPLKEFKNKYLKLCQHLNEASISKLILLSSISVYGNKNKVIKNEKLKISPISKYSKRCFAAENISNKIFEDKCITLRISNVFGKYRLDKGTIEKILSNFLFKTKHILNNSKYKRTYISATSLVEIIFILINKKIKKNLVLNIGNPNYIFEFKQILSRTEKIFKKRMNLKFNNKKIKNNYNSICYPATLINKFNFKFKDNFKNEILDLYNFIKKNETK